jgi:Flp pilus assembly pilin Flp
MLKAYWNSVMSRIRGLRDEEEGQDLIEYTLLLAFVCLASAALFIAAGNSVNTIWSAANVLLSSAAAGIPSF